LDVVEWSVKRILGGKEELVDIGSSPRKDAGTLRESRTFSTCNLPQRGREEAVLLLLLVP
jgi:hypothetical protein